MLLRLGPSLWIYSLICDSLTMQAFLIRAGPLAFASSIYFLIFQQTRWQGRLVCGRGGQCMIPIFRLLRSSLPSGIGNAGCGVMERTVRFQTPKAGRGQRKEGPRCASASGFSLTQIHLSVEREEEGGHRSDDCPLSPLLDPH